MINKKLIMIIFGLFFTLTISLVSAHEHNFAETKQLIDSGISCDKLTDEQLEAIGEYYMEQMHPGEAHELMDKMMGGGDSESLKQMHINMAKILYCNENVSGMMSSGGMMGMMSMMSSGNMMNGGMMGGNMMDSGSTDMMGGFKNNFGYWNFINFLYVTFLIGLIILVILLIIKLWKNIGYKKK